MIGRRFVLLLLVLASAGCDGPEDVVAEAVRAAAAGDAEAYEACFTKRSRPFLRIIRRTASRVEPRLADLGAGEVDVGAAEALPPDEDGTARALVPIQEGPRAMPVVLHSLAGAWRIDLVDTERATSRFGGDL